MFTSRARSGYVAWIAFGWDSVQTDAGRLWLVAPDTEHYIGPLGNPRIRPLHLSEEVSEILVASYLRVESVPCTRIRLLQSVVKHPHKVAVLVLDLRNLLATIHFVLLTIGSYVPLF